MRIKSVITGLCIAAVLWPAGTAGAQSISRAQLSRPADQGPSQRVGLVGGLSTREGVRDIQRRSPAGPPMGIQRGAFFGSFGLTREDAPYQWPAAVLPADVGTASPWGRRGPMLQRVGQHSNIDLQRVSGYGTALSFALPLMGVDSPRIKPPMRYDLTPPTHGNGFNDFFGLTAAVEAPPAPESDPEPLPTLAERLTEWNESSIDMMMLRARRTFKAATRTDNPTASEDLARVQSILDGVRRLRPDDAETELLALHAALGKNQIVTASRSLLRLVLKQPDFFVQGVDVASYFGDPDVLRDQMRRFLRVGDENPQVGEAQALQAYCAWVLGDLVRVRLTIEEISKMEPGPESTRATRIAFAINAALK